MIAINIGLVVLAHFWQNEIFGLLLVGANLLWGMAKIGEKVIEENERRRNSADW